MIFLFVFFSMTFWERNPLQLKRARAVATRDICKFMQTCILGILVLHSDFPYIALEPIVLSLFRPFSCVFMNPA